MDEKSKEEILKSLTSKSWFGFVDDYLDAPDRYRYQTDTAHLLFMDAVIAAIGQYEKDLDWLKLAKELWTAFSSYVGLGYSEERVMNRYDDDPRVARLYRKRTEKSSTLLAGLFDISFDLLYQEQKMNALETLQLLLKEIRIERATEASLTRGNGPNIEMYDYFLTMIEAALSAPRTIEICIDVSGSSECSSVIRNFEDFCFEKIKQMPEDQRDAFLSINTGDSSFFDLGISWKKEYNVTSGKTPIKDHKSPISRAKKRYKDLMKS